LQIAVPRDESGIVHRVVDARIALSRLGWQIVDKIKVPVVSGQRSMDVATHISSYLSSISIAWPGRFAPPAPGGQSSITDGLPQNKVIAHDFPLIVWRIGNRDNFV
jgi:hypothetical protein